MEEKSFAELPQVLGRDKVDGQRLQSRDGKTTPCRARLGNVLCATIASEGGLEEVGRREDERVGPGAVAVGDDQRCPWSLAQGFVQFGRIKKRTVDGKHGNAVSPKLECDPDARSSGLAVP